MSTDSCLVAFGVAMAQDVTAEAFRIVFERWGQYTPELGSERAWLFGVASNVIRRHLRSEQRRFSALERLSAAEQVSPDDGVDTDERIDSAGEARRVLSALSRLDPDDRDLLILVTPSASYQGQLVHASIAFVSSFNMEKANDDRRNRSFRRLSARCI